jgi:hypothetical protein
MNTEGRVYVQEIVACFNVLFQNSLWVLRKSCLISQLKFELDTFPTMSAVNPASSKDSYFLGLLKLSAARHVFTLPYEDYKNGSVFTVRSNAILTQILLKADCAILSVHIRSKHFQAISINVKCKLIFVTPRWLLFFSTSADIHDDIHAAYKPQLLNTQTKKRGVYSVAMRQNHRLSRPEVLQGFPQSLEQ